MNDRAVSLLDQYEIEVNRTWKGRGAILCDSDRGLLILKEIYDGIRGRQECLSLKDLAVTGSDLIALGMPAGKEIGVLLKELLEIVLEEPERNTREELLSVILSYRFT